MVKFIFLELFLCGFVFNYCVEFYWMNCFGYLSGFWNIEGEEGMERDIGILRCFFLNID